MASQTGLVEYVKRGAHDDNLEGAVLTKIAQGDLVRVPFPNTLTATTVGTSTINHGGSALNPDNSQHGYTLTVPPGLTQAAILRMTVYGRVIGVRAQRVAGAVFTPITVKVDGIVHPWKNTQGRRNAQTTAFSDYESLFIIASDLLSDGPHTVEISIASDPYGGTTRAATLFGLLLEQSKGYAPYPQVGTIGSPQAVTASAVTITASGFPVRKLEFYNTSAATRTVTIKSGANVIKTLQLAATGTAATVLGGPSADSATYDFGMPVDLTGITVQADATGVNLYTMQGARAR